jgi:pimeloyl-ACP methyl ester carboxylesterase
MSNEHDLTPVHTPPEVEGVARVIGGVGGIRFQWEELDKGAQILGDAAEELTNVVGIVAAMNVRLSALQLLVAGNVPASAASFSSGAAAAEAIGVARQRLQHSSSELRTAGDKIRGSRFAYEAADVVVRGLIGDFQTNINSHGSLPLIAPPLTLEHTKTETTRLDGTIDNLLAQVSHATGEPGNAFEVLEVDGESGATYVVVIPGSEGSKWEDPFSFYGIAEAKDGNSRYVHDAVARALEEVGADEGANVILVGYSQGGMHAMNLANSGPLPEKYSIEHVVTAGSPVEREETPEDTTFLHLAHTWDVVPHADLLPHEDRPNQVSVVLDHHAQLRQGEDFGLGPAHKINSYREGAQAVDISSHPSIAPITAALGAAVAGSTARRHVFQVTRPPLIGPQPAPTNATPSERKAKEGLAPGSGDRSSDK